MALGLSANEVPAIKSLENQAVSKSLQTSIVQLIASANRLRPDLAALVANLRASKAAVTQMKAQFYLVAGLSADYGENLWNFTFGMPRAVQTGQPQYSTLLALNGISLADSDDSTTSARQKPIVKQHKQNWRPLSSTWPRRCGGLIEFESSLSKYDHAGGFRGII